MVEFTVVDAADSKRLVRVSGMIMYALSKSKER